MKNKKIKIKCITCHTIDIHNYHIHIYDINNKLIFKNTTDNKGYLYFYPPYFGLYKIIILLEDKIPKKICTNIYINKNSCNTLLFTFNNCYKKNEHIINILITDKNYQGLPIMKGEINLWPKIT